MLNYQPFAEYDKTHQDIQISDRLETNMQVQYLIEDQLVTDHAPEEVQKELRTGLILYKYLQSELSLGGVAQLLDTDPESVLDWLSSLRVPTSRPMASELEFVSAQNAERFL